VLVELHVSEHHDGRHEESGGISLVLASNVGGSAVDGLKDCAIRTLVARGRETQATDEAGEHV